ncbi:MAG: SAM-dependent methyltransferase [Allobaculum sp.]|nr:SAM-dependent methyltransferase [Allobaculum sp.]
MRDKLISLTEVSNIEEIGDKFLDYCLENNFEMIEKIDAILPDHKRDWFQKIYQYYLADREEKKQDFTPPSLGILIDKLSGEDMSVIDLCSGSGSLMIQSWNENPKREFRCYELDKKVIPFLLMNAVIRNMKASIVHGDVLKEEIFKTYTLEPTETGYAKTTV